MTTISTRYHTHSKGFALIATLSLIVLLALVAVSIITLSSVNVGVAKVQNDSNDAQEKAKIGLAKALEQLQSTAGHDQRITATADLILDNDGTNSEKRNWVGIWDTSSYDPSSYNPSSPRANKPFISWLVSSQDSDSLTNTSPTDVSIQNPLIIFPGYTDDNGTTSGEVEVDRIPTQKLKDGNLVNTGSYAYWVSDEGVKASLGRSNHTLTDEIRQQAAKLSVASGIDPSVFQDSTTETPFTFNSKSELSADNSFLSNLSKLTSLNDLALADNASTSSKSYSEWRHKYRHQLTSSSKAVLSDTQLGGLQRDLSLAFEMDGDAEAEDADNFNAQASEFVSGGNDDVFGATRSLGGLPTKARYLFAETKSSNGFFSDDIPDHSARTRGPTWWLLRDYANLYKNVRLFNEQPTLDARAYYPNKAEGEQYGAVGQVFGSKTSTSQYGLEFDTATKAYIPRPAKANYAPVSLGSSNFISLKSEGNEVVACMDILFYFWNPYSCNITFDNLVVSLSGGLPGVVALWKHEDGSDSPTPYYNSIDDLLKNNYPSNKLNFLVRDTNGTAITLAPGEIIVASPQSLDFQAPLGYNFSPSSGIIMRNLADKTPLLLNDNDQISYNFYKPGGSNYKNKVTVGFQTFLGDSSLIPSEMDSDTKFTHELQSYGQSFIPILNDVAASLEPSEYIVGNLEAPAGEILKSNLPEDAKQYFAVCHALLKPAKWEGGNANPVDVFTRFNPLCRMTKREQNRVCSINHLLHMESSNNASALFQSSGITPSSSNRNAYWGETFTNLGTQFFPVKNIPIAPLFSLAQFANANASEVALDPLHPIANSYSSPFVPVNSVYGNLYRTNKTSVVKSNFTTKDLSWLCNNALFDRYFFSGITPDYTLTSNGYSTTSTLEEAIGLFYHNVGSATSQAIIPHLPNHYSIATIVQDITPNDGYKKVAAYSLINNAFNINSTSVLAWSSLLRANRDLALDDFNNTSHTNSGTPFPLGQKPYVESDNPWTGYKSLTNAQIDTLSAEIVRIVKERGPFMSLSDFINRQMGYHTGVIQKAIEDAGINNDIANLSGGDVPIYAGVSDDSYNFFPYAQESPNRTTASGIPGEVNQAELLIPIAPKLRPRSDTFIIRAYGETTNSNGSIISEAMCEATVQRLPEYFDSAGNAPWDEHTNISEDYYNKTSPEDSTLLSNLNQQYGRRFVITSLRWLNKDEY